MEQLFGIYRDLLSATPSTFMRYMHDKISWKSRLVVLMGARGVGKTTLVLQRIKLQGEEDSSLYIDAGNTYFAANRLFDVAKTFHLNGGKTLYIDEVHKYKDWSREVKMMHDILGGLKVVVTGSSMLDIKKGTDADLSRRALTYTMEGLSFREYLNFSLGLNLPVYSLDDIVAGKIEFPYKEHRPIALFKEYLQRGYYPFFGTDNYLTRLDSVVGQTLEVDIPSFAQMNVSTAVKLKKLLYVISRSVPFKPNLSEIGRAIETDRGTVADYLFYMEKAGLIRQLRFSDEGMKFLEKTDKIYLANTNLAHALSEGTPDIGNIRETVFFSSLAVNNFIASAPAGDFRVEKYTFEVGGKNKKQKQIADVPNAYVVKDDIEHKGWKDIPLWFFGLNY